MFNYNCILAVTELSKSSYRNPIEHNNKLITAHLFCNYILQNLTKSANRKMKSEGHINVYSINTYWFYLKYLLI
jgi:hypothetical protein